MRKARAASALIVAIWLADAASAQQTISGPPTLAAPTPASAPTATQEPDANDNPTESADWRERLAAARQRHDQWVACVAAKGSNCSPTPVLESDPLPDPMELLLNDDTLVNGDVVSTPSGLKVFRGRPDAPHSLSDFQ